MTTPAPPPLPLLFVDRRGAAEILAVSSSTLAHLVGRGGPPMIRIGRRVVYRVCDLVAWAETRRVAPGRRPGRPRKGS